MIGLFGGAFDPPHNGHLALATTAKQELGLDSLVVLVSSAPAHKTIATPADVRLALAQAAFPDDEVVLDPLPRTVDLLRVHPEWEDATFLLGADEFCDLRSWKEPDEVLRRVEIAVATRPGFPEERLDAVLDGLATPGRVRFFEIEPHAIASRDLRSALDRGNDVHDLVPASVWALIERDGLYGRGSG
ncbi:MAG: nicotinate-nucleotide adenylyltransferase [Actinomycetes bacterium]